MESNFTHLIISRVALKWRYTELSLSWDEWVKNSWELYNAYTRPSLKNQTCQNFKLVTVIDESVEVVGDTLENEIIVKIQSGENLKRALNRTIKLDTDYVLITRIDRDDLLRYDYVSCLQSLVKCNKTEYYLDAGVIYRKEKDNWYLTERYTKMTSPFISTLERINKEGLIKCYPYVKSHTKINELIPGKKYLQLAACQTIHGTNVLNKVEGYMLPENYNKLFIKHEG